MKEYIERDKFYETESLLMIDIVKKDPLAKFILEQVLFEIKEAPAADVKEVVHAKWIGKPIAGYSTVRCSNCKMLFKENNGRWKFCPECGAIMDLN